MANGFFIQELCGADRSMIGMGEDVYVAFGGFSPVSFNVIAARLLGLPYDDFLRIARDTYHGTIEGVNCACPYITFSNDASGEGLRELVRILNSRWKEFLKRIGNENDDA